MKAIRLVALHEFTERLRSRTFLISNGAVLLLLVLSVALPAMLGDGDPDEVGALPGEAISIARIAAAQQDSFDLQIEVQEIAGEAEARQAVEAGELDAALLDAGTILVRRSLDPALESLLANAANSARVDRRLAEAGLNPEERATLFTIDPMEVVSLTEDGEAVDPFSPQVMVAFVGVFALYGLLVLYGQWVAQGIVEEKQSRVVEILLSTLRPTELLAGKIAGLGLLGFVQILLIAGVGVTTLIVTDAVELPRSGYGSLVLVVAWYIPGYLLYATLFAMSGALIARVEDLQSAVMPVVLVLVLALFGAQAAISDPTSTVAAVAGIVPFTAPMVQPVLAASGVASAWQMIVAAVAAVAVIAGLLPVCGRVYRGGILATRTRVSFREAWGSSRGNASRLGRTT